jgi:hypothetical protein
MTINAGEGDSGGRRGIEESKTREIKTRKDKRK